MRAASAVSLFALVLLVAPATVVSELWADETKSAIDNKELNFKVSLPADSVDWDVVKIDTKKFPTLRAHFQSIFVDSGAYAEVRVYVQKLGSAMVRKKIQRIGAQWKDSLEANLENPHDRKAEVKQFAGVEAFIVDVQGIQGTELHRLNWMICKNGQYLYSIIITRTGKDAVRDEQLQEEIDGILASFKFHEIKKITKAKGAAKGDAPKGPGGKEVDGKGKKEDMPGIDPKLLKKEQISSSFWRLKFTKPAGLMSLPLSESLKANQIKWDYRGTKNSIVMGFRVYVWSLKNKKYTLDKLVDNKLKWWKTRVKQSKPPKLDKKFKGIPLAKKAYKLELLGRSTRTERWIYILAECKNDRQYQIEIYTMGDSGGKQWGKAVEQLIKGILPQKK